MLLPCLGGRRGREGGSLRLLGNGVRRRLILVFGPLWLFLRVKIMRFCFSCLWDGRGSIGPRKW